MVLENLEKSSAKVIGLLTISEATSGLSKIILGDKQVTLLGDTW
jgi:hypothetical protein